MAGQSQSSGMGRPQPQPQPPSTIHDDPSQVAEQGLEGTPEPSQQNVAGQAPAQSAALSLPEEAPPILREQPPAGSENVGDDRRFSVQRDKHVIYEQFGRGPGEDDKKEPPVNDELEELLKPYVLVIKRVARPKWIAFTKEELAGLGELELNRLVHRYLFPAIPDEHLCVTFITGIFPTERNSHTFKKSASEEKREDWKKILCPDRYPLPKNDQRYEWLVIRHYDEEREFVALRDSWMLEFPKRWYIYSNFERRETDIWADEEELERQNRANEEAGRPFNENYDFGAAALALIEAQSELAARTIEEFDSVLKELFPVAYAEGKTFWLQVDRYKKEWIEYPRELHSPDYAANTQSFRDEWFRRVLWRIDDPVVNIYPDGRNLNATYEQFEELKRAYLEEQRRGQSAGREADTRRPQPLEVEEQHTRLPEGQTEVSTISRQDTAMSAQSGPLSPGAILARANEMICRDHKGCRARLDVMNEKQRREHASMHGGARCEHEGCHALMGLMNNGEAAAHQSMHARWSQSEADAAATAMKMAAAGSGYVVEASRRGWTICPRHPKCHAKMQLMDEKDYRWHDHMHTARRCKLNVDCHTALDLLNGREVEQHLKMHADHGDDSGEEIRMLLESPGIYQSSDQFIKLLQGAQGHIFEQNPLQGGELPEEEADGGGTKQKPARTKGTRPKRRSPSESSDELIEQQPKGKKRARTGASGTGEVQQPPTEPVAQQPEAGLGNMDPNDWEAGWEPGVNTKDGTNKWEHCPVCDACLNSLAKAAKTKHLQKHGNPRVRYKTYRKGKTRVVELD